MLKGQHDLTPTDAGAKKKNLVFLKLDWAQNSIFLEHGNFYKHFTWTA